jgi:hypothetical protein
MKYSIMAVLLIVKIRVQISDSISQVLSFALLPSALSLVPPYCFPHFLLFLENQINIAKLVFFMKENP